MFTGLIEETGIVANIKKQNNSAVISINCAKILDDLKHGDSVAIDGACQTVTKITKNSGFEVETSKETLDLFIKTIRALAEKAKSGDAEFFAAAPRHTPRRRLDETAAARSPVLRWKPEA